MYTFLLDATDAQPAQGDAGFNQTLVMLAIGLLLFYFMLFRPEQKRRKAEETKRASLKKGDRITTVSGIIGTISKINADTIVLRMIDGAKMEIVKAAVGDVQPISEEEAKKLSHDD